MIYVKKGAPDFPSLLSPASDDLLYFEDKVTKYQALVDSRRSARMLDKSQNVDIDKLGSVLSAALKVTSWRQTVAEVSFPLRRTPSCGALNSVGALVWLENSNNHKSSTWYEYDPIRHALVKDGDCEPNIDWQDFTYGQRPFSSASVVLALYHRSSLFHWKYTDASAYEAVFAEAGAVIMGLSAQAAEFGLVAVPTNAMKTEILDSIFPPEKYHERYPLFLVALGYPDPVDNEDYSSDIIAEVFGTGRSEGAL